jgi:hypothetical protein
MKIKEWLGNNWPCYLVVMATIGIVVVIVVHNFGVYRTEAKRIVVIPQATEVEHKAKYYLKGAEHGIICIHADSNWQGDFIVYCTAAIEEGMELVRKMNESESKKGGK